MTLEKIITWTFRFPFAEMCKEKKKVAIMEALVQVWVAPDQALVKEGAALLRTFCNHIFEDDKLTNDDFDFLDRANDVETLLALRSAQNAVAGPEQRTFPVCDDEDDWSTSAYDVCIE